MVGVFEFVVCGLFKVSAVGIQFFFKAFDEREGIGGRTGKTGQHFSAQQNPDFFDVTFGNGISHRGLPVGSEGYLSVVPNTDYRCCLNFGLHEFVFVDGDNVWLGFLSSLFVACSRFPP